MAKQAAGATTSAKQGSGAKRTAGRGAGGAPFPPPRLLGGFDPVLFGWIDRKPLLGDNQSVITMNGIFKPIALVKGRAAATWTTPKGEVELAPFGRIAKADREALAADAEDVKRFLAA